MGARALFGGYVAVVGVLCGAAAVALAVSGDGVPFGGSARTCGPGADAGCLPEVASVGFAPWALLSAVALVASAVILGSARRGGGAQRRAPRGGGTAGSRRARAAGLAIVLVSLVVLACGTVAALEVSFETAWIGHPQNLTCASDPCTFGEVLGHGRVWSRGGSGLLLGAAGLVVVALAERRGVQRGPGGAARRPDPATPPTPPAGG